MDDVKAEEYRFLRQEHEANRKLVFERPMIIVGATIAAALSVSERGALGLLPVPFLAVLAFNLWFTYNRLESSSRIVAYLQLVHEGDPAVPWIGWENALRQYRKWLFDVQHGRREAPVLRGELRQFDSSAFYGPIYSFHVLLGFIVTGLLVSRSEAASRAISRSPHIFDLASLGGCLLALLVFCSACARFRPQRVHHLTEWKRQAWLAVLGATRELSEASTGEQRVSPSAEPLSGTALPTAEHRR